MWSFGEILRRKFHINVYPRTDDNVQSKTVWENIRMTTVHNLFQYKKKNKHLRILPFSISVYARKTSKGLTWLCCSNRCCCFFSPLSPFVAIPSFDYFFLISIIFFLCSFGCNFSLPLTSSLAVTLLWQHNHMHKCNNGW